MKRFVLLFTAVIAFVGMHAQELTENEPVIIYYSPRTTVVLDFEYTLETRLAGRYALYAEELLGARDIVEENQTRYQLNHVSFATRTETDRSRSHKVAYDAEVPQLLSINDKGLLVGYNLPAKEPKKSDNKPKKSTSLPHKDKRTVPPFAEEILEARSLADEAQIVAKQIFRLRETKQYLLSGEVEHSPADGKAMKHVLDELDQQEAELVALFIGTTSTTRLHQSIEITPTNDAEPQIHKAFYFSEENGFTEEENIDADTIQVCLNYSRPTVSAPQETKKKQKKTKSPQLSQISYNLPGAAYITVHYQGKVMNHKNLPIAQLGVDVPLSKDLFRSAELPVIVFNEKTGNIVSISK